MSGRTTRQRVAVIRVLAGCQDLVPAQELYTLPATGGNGIGPTAVAPEVVERGAGRNAADTGFATVEHTVEPTGIRTACRLIGAERADPVVAVPPLGGEARRRIPHRPAEQITADDLRAALLGTPYEGACE